MCIFGIHFHFVIGLITFIDCLITDIYSSVHGRCALITNDSCLYTTSFPGPFPYPAEKALGTRMTCTLEKLNLFHGIEMFWKYCRKRLENPISIALYNSIVWECFPWYGTILEILSKYSANKTWTILWKSSSFSPEVSYQYAFITDRTAPIKLGQTQKQNTPLERENQN